ncbi:MAG: cation:proton antiporter [Chloroflexales bacterium]|nr:cation:proton antiporter [Chloroflexales bacterium]
MEETFLISFAGIFILGVGAQWLAWRFRLPSILLLLLFGFIAGPATGSLHPESLFGEMLFPAVSLAVAIILFEGGMSLKIAELRSIGSVLFRLISGGALATLTIISAAAYWLLDLNPSLAILLGAILVVTGPTVIGPLLRYVRPSGQVGAILNWEGIVIDPVGAMFAVLVFEAIIAGGFQEATTVVFAGIMRTLGVGLVVGALGAGLMILLLRRYWVPDFLQNPVVLMMVTGVFVAANVGQTESGLLAVTVMGIIMANQPYVPVRHIVEFKENLRTLLIASLFIVLTARLEFSDLTGIGIESLIFLAVVIVIARPAAVALSTIGSGLNWRERIFLAWMAPRGIVAASVSSIFALRMVEAGIPSAERLVPLTFLVIAGTVAFYSLTVAPVARLLRVVLPNPQGALIVGADSVARTIARALHEKGYQVLLVDTNPANITAAKREDLPTSEGNVLADDLANEINLGGIGRLLALTPNDQVNTLAVIEYAQLFGRAEVYQLSLPRNGQSGKGRVSQKLHGRLLFGPDLTHEYLARQLSEGAVIKTTQLVRTSDSQAFRTPEGEFALPLFLLGENGTFTVVTADRAPVLRQGQMAICLVGPSETSPATARMLQLPEPVVNQ